MEFCPKCGGLLIPQKVGRAKMLVCQRCGRKFKPKHKTTYRIAEKGKEKEDVAVIVEKKRRKNKKLPEREYEVEPPEYYEEYFEE